jgi:hypothetical protein
MGVFVFTTDGKTHISNYAKLKMRLDSYDAAAGEGLAPWRLHDLRRSAATHMVRLGVSVEVVGRVLNHAVRGLTARVYALHSYGPEKRQALDAWSAEVDRALIETQERHEVENGMASNRQALVGQPITQAPWPWQCRPLDRATIVQPPTLASQCNERRSSSVWGTFRIEPSDKWSSG